MLSKYFVIGFFVQLIVFSTLFGKSVEAQLNNPVHANLQNVSVKQVFDILKKTANVTFVYDTKKVDCNQIVNISNNQLNGKEILKQLASKLDFSYKKIGNTITIKKKSVDKKTKGPYTLPMIPSKPRIPLSSARLAPLNKKEAKQFQISGTVTDSSGNPLMGVSVKVKSTKNATTTDAQGHYVINASKNATLIFSYVGYQKKEVNVNSREVINVSLKASITGLNQLVVTGYSKQKKLLLTGSIVTMDNVYKLKNIPTTSLGNLLAGKMAGVKVSTPDGIAGQQPGISIRTGSSWNPQPALYVIDGKISGSGDFNNLSPNMIKSISVLKDASAKAIYGSRADGGVILVTTRRGHKGKATFDFSYNTGIDTRTKNMPLTNAIQTGELYNRINPTSDPANYHWSQSDFDYFKQIDNGWGYDQLEAIWHNPQKSTYNLSASGGGNVITYFIGGSYVKKQGFLELMTYDKYNIRANITADLTNDFKLFAGLALQNDLTGHIPWGPYDLYQKLLIWQPDQPVYTNTGKPIDYGWIANVGASAHGADGYSESNHLKPFVYLKAQYNFSFIPGLSVKAAYSSSFSYDRTRTYRHHYPMYMMERNGRIISTNDSDIVGTKMSSVVNPPYLQEDVAWGQDYQLDLKLNYDHTFNSVHHIQALLVYEKFRAKGGGVYGGRQKFPVFTTDQWWATSSSQKDSYVGGPTSYVSPRISYIGQFNYGYREKYLLSFSFREDGSMNFAPDQRWGFFPAGAVGWIISKEHFLSDSKTIDYLKLRLSVGMTGNDAVGGWQWQNSYQGANSYYFGTNPSKVAGITYGGVVNPGLTWEKSLSYDAGVDMNFQKHWQTTVEYWFRKTFDILGPRNASVPPTFSLSLPDENYGQINAQGVDFSLDYDNSSGSFNYYAKLTASYGWNKVITKDYPENAPDYAIPEGRSTSYIYGRLSEGIIRTKVELKKYANSDYNYFGTAPALGQLVFKDVSGPEGKPDGIINDYDNVVLKKSNFPIVYGLNFGGSWKGFNIDIMLNGRLKHWKNYVDMAHHVEWNRMWKAWYNDSWTPENPDAMLPKRLSWLNSAAVITYWYGNTDFWWTDASYIRLKYVNLNYTLPVKWYSKYNLGAIKIFFSGVNLFELSDFKYYDPELGSGTSYPIMRSFNFGLDIKF